MALIPWKGKRQNGDVDTPGSPLSTFRSEFDRLFDRFDRFIQRPFALGEDGGFGEMGGWVPSLDVTDTDKEITLRAEVPGVDPKDLDITVSGHVLTIAGEKKQTTEKKGENFYHTERRFGSFRRSVQLPTSVDRDKMTADHKNGVVIIRFQKLESAAPKRIPVQSATS